MSRVCVFLLAVARAAAAEGGYTAPTPSGAVLFLETFQEAWDSRWTHSAKEVPTTTPAASPWARLNPASRPPARLNPPPRVPLNPSEPTPSRPHGPG